MKIPSSGLTADLVDCAPPTGVGAAGETKGRIGLAIPVGNTGAAGRGGSADAEGGVFGTGTAGELAGAAVGAACGWIPVLRALRRARISSGVSPRLRKGFRGRVSALELNKEAFCPVDIPSDGAAGLGGLAAGVESGAGAGTAIDVDAGTDAGVTVDAAGGAAGVAAVDGVESADETDDGAGAGGNGVVALEAGGGGVEAVPVGAAGGFTGAFTAAVGGALPPVEGAGAVDGMVEGAGVDTVPAAAAGWAGPVVVITDAGTGAAGEGAAAAGEATGGVGSTRASSPEP